MVTTTDPLGYVMDGIGYCVTQVEFGTTASVVTVECI